MSRFKLVSIIGKKTQGFSLVELLVAMALVGILAGVGGSIFILVNNTTSRAAALSKLQTQNSQTLEVLERAIRSSGSAEVLVAGSQGCLVDASSCLKLQIVTDSIEYRLNNGCYYTYYAWYAPTASANGRLVRYYLDQSLGNCPAAATPYDLFDVDLNAGTSIEDTNGSGNVFTLLIGEDGINQVRISAILRQGVGWKPSSGTDNRMSVPMLSVTGLRTY